MRACVYIYLRECVFRLLVQDLSDEPLLSTEAVLEGRAAERDSRHRRRPAQETPRTLAGSPPLLYTKPMQARRII